MTKIALIIEYNGYHYSGWQRQESVATIQQQLERALTCIADESISVTCSGRTDAGVHALKQVVHFETNSNRETSAWTLGCNSILPDDISVTWAAEIDAEFNARFSAEKRTYQYVILNRRTRPGLFHGLVSWQCRKLDEERMFRASRCLLGEHDFSSYRAVACQSKTPFRRVDKIGIDRYGDWLIISITANAFLHHMVRNIVGVLMEIGYGKQGVDWAERVLLAKDRTAGGVTAPAGGLYLSEVHYPERFEIPESINILNKLSIN